MGEVTTEFDDAINRLNLTEKHVVKLSYQANQILFTQLLNHFVIGGDRRWWWEAFKEDSFRFAKYDYNPDHLEEIIPDLTKHVWIMIEDDQQKFHPIYDINPLVIKDVLNECFFFEYYIIDKDLNWLICENHHKYLIGIGEQLRNFNKDRIGFRPI